MFDITQCVCLIDLFAYSWGSACVAGVEYLAKECQSRKEPAPGYRRVTFSGLVPLSRRLELASTRGAVAWSRVCGSVDSKEQFYSE